jgi:hypothetical protein
MGMPGGPNFTICAIAVVRPLGYGRNAVSKIKPKGAQQPRPILSDSFRLVWITRRWKKNWLCLDRAFLLLPVWTKLAVSGRSRLEINESNAPISTL